MLRSAWVLALLLVTAATATTVRAETTSRENVIFAYAQVLRADPVFERVLVTEQVERCEDQASLRVRARPSRPQPRTPVPVAAQAPGETLVQRGCNLVEEDREVNRLAGYDVEYRYRGDVFISRVQEDPGDRLRIRIAVSPALDVGPR